MKPFLCAALRITRLFERGKRNALAVRVREVCFSLPKLPEAFEGFRLLHLSDLHLDGAPGLTDRLVNLLAGFHVDLCVLTGDYRFDVSGSCEEAWPTN